MCGGGRLESHCEFPGFFFSCDTNIVVLARDLELLKEETTRVMLWHQDQSSEEIHLPGRLRLSVKSIALNFPFIILSLDQWPTDLQCFGRFEKEKGSSWIKVYRVETDTATDRFNPEVQLIKSIQCMDGTPNYPHT